MTDPIVHVSVFVLMTVVYFACWLFGKDWEEGYKWYIPFAAAFIVFGFLEAIAWPFWYLFIR